MVWAIGAVYSQFIGNKTTLARFCQAFASLLFLKTYNIFSIPLASNIIVANLWHLDLNYGPMVSDATICPFN